MWFDIKWHQLMYFAVYGWIHGCYYASIVAELAKQGVI